MTPILGMTRENNTPVIDFANCASAFEKFGAANRAAYNSNKPFEHIVIDNLFPDELLRIVVDELEHGIRYETSKNFYGSKQKFATANINLFSPVTKRFLLDLNSSNMLNFLEALTGIDGLVSDPHYFGGGYHEIRRGGFLKMHTDFNWHQKLKLDRRLNMLVYLNENWDEKWGGLLTLASPDFHEQKSVSPVFNRTVVFSTTDFSFHGHPDPLECPEEVKRRSIALYFYTNGRPAHEVNSGNRVSTDYRERPGEIFEKKEKSIASKFAARVRKVFKG